MHRLIVSSLAALLAAGSLAAVPGQYLVLREKVATGEIALLSSTPVELAALPASTPAVASENRLRRSIAVRITDVSGKRTLFETSASASRWRRGEFAGKDGQIDSHLEPLDEVTYVVRVPRLHGQLQANGVVRQLNARAALSLDLDALPATAAKPLASGSVTSLIHTGSPANRLDILIVGDGYTADQEAKFQQDAAATAQRFLSITPYKDYSNLINFSALFVASPQSGASKPACAETPNDPVISVNTAFGAQFCTSGLRRLVTVDDEKVFAAAAAVPDWDHIFVVVNDTEYGGSGGEIAVATLNSAAAQLIQHEFGHSFTLLADEYDTAYPGFPSCSDLPGSASPCEPNVTDQTNAAQVKWHRWFTTGETIPTVGKLTDPLAAGLWLGARYQSSGMYRQCYDGIMRSFDNGLFCHVDAEAFVQRLYAGEWGVPSGGVRNIEPDGIAPAPNSTAAAGDCNRYQAKVAGPAGVNLDYSWTVDGQAVQSGHTQHGATLQYDGALTQGSHTVALTVSDQSALILDKPQAANSWAVAAGAAAAKSQSDRLFDWAEKTYPALFSPAGQKTQSLAQYQVRYYAGTQNYVGTSGCTIYVYGPISGNQLLSVGQVVDFMPLAAGAGF